MRRPVGKISRIDLGDDPDFNIPILEPYEVVMTELFPREWKQMTEAEEADPDVYDQYDGAEVLLLTGDHYQTGRVVGRK